MKNWGVLTWVGVLILALVLLIYWVGTVNIVKTGSTAFGNTVQALTGKLGGTASYAKG